MQASLIGDVRERRRDQKVRDAMHHQWLEKQDAREMREVVEGIQRGFRRVRRGGLAGDEVRRTRCRHCCALAHRACWQRALLCLWCQGALLV